ncbi:MAG TPA: efflux RND transporter permease subunit [Terriglobia bacterium]|jgi:multidrug efflux pump subunit AcrA (membrane-fusion protein)|nr:efflux RND transporter permease subunit [Terriglobia bacterium]
MAPPPTQVEHEQDGGLFKVDHPEQFPLAMAGEDVEAPDLEVTGSVAPDVSRSIPVISIATGRVLEISVRLGDTVTKGQTLMRVQSADISQAFSDYRQALADETLALTQLDRSKLLYDHGAIALNDLQVAEDTEAKAKVTVETALDHLRVLGADVNNASAIVEVRAPASGIITDQEVTVAAGTQGLASPNAFTISDLSHVWILCDVYENDLPFVRLGEYADIHLNAYPDVHLKGRIGNIGPILDPNIRTAKVRLEVANSNPQYDAMDLKSIEDWVVEKNLKSVPNIVDVKSFGGPTREYQVRVDPDKLVAYGLSIGQVEQQLTNNNVNAGGSFIEAGLQQINVRSVGLVRNVQDIGQTVIMSKNGTPLRVKDIAVVAQGPKIRLGQFGRASRRQDGKIIDNDDAVSGIALLRKGAEGDRALEGLHEKIRELNSYILPPGVKLVPFIDRSDLVHFTTHTVLHNLSEGIILVVIVLLLLLGNVRGALIAALTIPFSLLFASICLDLKHIPANLLSLGALDFGMVVDGSVVMVENIVRHLHRREEAAIEHGALHFVSSRANPVPDTFAALRRGIW